MSKLHKKCKSNCMLCEDSLSSDNSVIFHKTRRQTHSLCLECAISYLKPKINQILSNIQKNNKNNINDIKCPGSIHCQSRNLCKIKIKLSLLKIKECELSLNIFKILYIFNNETAFMCPNLICAQLVDVDYNYPYNKLNCSDCYTTWCKNCYVSPYHEDKSCIEYEIENNKSENGKLILELKEKGNLKFCPQCKAPSMKHNGCNKMYCINCQCKWCWLCSSSNIDYDHYSKSKCNGKLWEGVDINGNEIFKLIILTHFYLFYSDNNLFKTIHMKFNLLNKLNKF